MKRPKIITFVIKTMKKLAKDFQEAFLTPAAEIPGGMKVGFAGFRAEGMDYFGEDPVKSALLAIQTGEKKGDDYWGFVVLTERKEDGGTTSNALIFSFVSDYADHISLAGAECHHSKEGKVTCTVRDTGAMPIQEVLTVSPAIATFLYTFLAVSQTRMLDGAYDYS